MYIFSFRKYLHGSREGLILYGEHGWLMKLIGDFIDFDLAIAASACSVCVN